MRPEHFGESRKPAQEWRAERDRLIAHMRTFVPDGWERPLGTFAQLPNLLPTDLSAFAEHHAAGTLHEFLIEKYEDRPYGAKIAEAIEHFYGRDRE